MRKSEYVSKLFVTHFNKWKNNQNKEVQGVIDRMFYKYPALFIGNIKKKVVKYKRFYAISSTNS